MVKELAQEGGHVMIISRSLEGLPLRIFALQGCP